MLLQPGCTGMTHPQAGRGEGWGSPPGMGEGDSTMTTIMQLNNLTVFELMAVVPCEVEWGHQEGAVILHTELTELLHSVVNAEHYFLDTPDHYKIIPILERWLRWIWMVMSRLLDDIAA